MKLPPSSLPISLVLSIVCFSIFGCKTSKKNSKSDLSITILLEDGQGGSYIQKRYARFEPTGVKKSNRTLNEYRANFNLTKGEETELLEKLGTDPKVIKHTLSTKAGINIMSGKSRKSTKAKPRF